MSDDGLTRELLESIVHDIAVTKLPRKYAATKNGVSPSTLQRMIDLGTMGEGGPLHVELARRVHEAEGVVVGQHMGNLHELSEKDPRAGEIFLKLFKPGDFGGPRAEPDEFERLERQVKRRQSLLNSPPPRMLAEMTAAGWWQFPTDITDEDRAILVEMQQRYRARQLPEKAHV